MSEVSELRWRIVSKTYTNTPTEAECEDSGSSDLYIWMSLYGVSDGEAILGNECKKYMDRKGYDEEMFYVWQYDGCYRYVLKCEIR